jgi:hypothetical protein
MKPEPGAAAEAAAAQQQFDQQLRQAAVQALPHLAHPRSVSFDTFTLPATATNGAPAGAGGTGGGFGGQAAPLTRQPTFVPGAVGQPAGGYFESGDATPGFGSGGSSYSFSGGGPSSSGAGDRDGAAQPQAFPGGTAAGGTAGGLNVHWFGQYHQQQQQQQQQQGGSGGTSLSLLGGGYTPGPLSLLGGVHGPTGFPAFMAPHAAPGAGSGYEDRGRFPPPPGLLPGQQYLQPPPPAQTQQPGPQAQQQAAAATAAAAAAGDDISYSFYPGTGLDDAPEANVWNVALPPMWREKREAKKAASRKPHKATHGRFAVRRAVLERLLPCLRAFGPDLIIISAGFDGGAGDVGNSKNDGKATPGMNLTPEDFAWITAQLLTVSRMCCPGRVVSVLEGGYGQWRWMKAPKAQVPAAGAGGAGAGTTGASGAGSATGDASAPASATGAPPPAAGAADAAVNAGAAGGAGPPAPAEGTAGSTMAVDGTGEASSAAPPAGNGAAPPASVPGPAAGAGGGTAPPSGSGAAPAPMLAYLRRDNLAENVAAHVRALVDDGTTLFTTLAEDAAAAAVAAAVSGAPVLLPGLSLLS